MGQQPGIPMQAERKSETLYGSKGSQRSNSDRKSRHSDPTRDRTKAG